ncbi:MAG: amidohydrolase family protein [Acidobacteriota bacterium]|nr:amidohydrolase family protein [Acidobacteriota bacterium]
MEDRGWKRGPSFPLGERPRTQLADLMRSLINSMVVMACTLMLWPAVIARAQESCRTLLYNGKIATMNHNDATAASVTIEGDRIVAVGTVSGVPKHAGCDRLIDLKGRRVIPGLIDSHNHIVEVGLRPGHDVRLEVAGSIAEVQQRIRDKSKALGPGEWITAIDGWSPEQLAEKRMPTLSDLDAASSSIPIYVQIGFDGPAATNSAGKAFFEHKGIEVGADGSIAANEPTDAAYKTLAATRTFADEKREAADVMAYAASVGLTMSDDKGGPWSTDTPGAQGLAEVSNRTNALNPFTEYDPFLALARDGKMSMRLRIFFYMQDTTADLPFLKARLNNQFHDFGDDWLRVSGIGERIYSGPFPFTANSSPAIYEAAARLIAQKGWAYDEHGMGLADEKAFTDVWERVNRETPLATLHWCLAHVPGIDGETLNRLKAMGVGVSLAGGRYTATTPPRNSPREIPPFRMIAKSGIHAGYGSDGGTVAPLNPWLHLYYMVTGKNSAGQLVAGGQTLTRVQALRMYTANQPWFTGEDGKLGSIEAGKLADLVVLSDDFLDPAKVQEEAIRRITSVLTIVGGKIVYDGGALSIPKSPSSH